MGNWWQVYENGFGMFIGIEFEFGVFILDQIEFNVMALVQSLLVQFLFFVGFVLILCD